MQNLKLAFGALCLGFLLLMSCNDPTLIGSDVLEEDQFNIQSTDEIEILAKTVYAEPVQTYDRDVINFQLTDYLVGKINDPIFGAYQSSLFTEFDINGIPPEFAGATLDSAIILLPFDGEVIYGGTVIGESFEIELHQIATRLDTLEERFSNDMVETSELLETITITPSTDSVVVNVLNEMETQQLPSHIRIPVPMSLAEAIFNAPDSTFDSSNDFQAFFPGFELRPVGGAEGIFGIQLRTGTLIPQMRFFFSDTIQKSYNFPIGNFSTKFTTFEHDYTGTIVEEFVQKGDEGGDSLLFVHSMEGTDIELTFPNLEDFRDIVVNKAELVFEIDSIPGDDFDTYPPTTQMMINEVQDDGDLVLIEDLGILISRYGENDGFIIFGGSPQTDRTYSMNISGHFQRIIDGEASNVLRITPINGEPTFSNLNRGNAASRVVIKGPQNTQGSMKLILNYTKI